MSVETRLWVGWLEFDSWKGQELFLFAVSKLALGPGGGGGKQPGHEAEYTPPSSAEVKNVWSYISTSPHIFMVWCLVTHKDFIFYYK
jgi:hypothetical protein